MNGEWIKCSERLPDENESVLAVRVGTVTNMAIDWDGSWYTDGYGITVNKFYNDVTHWMPLPQPPEAE